MGFSPKGSKTGRASGSGAPPQRPRTVINAAWLSLCQATKAGPLPNLFNTLLALRLDPAWVGKLAYDEMLGTVVNPPNPVQDIDLYRMHEWLQENGLRRVGIETVREAVEIVAREHCFHPVRDWLDGLQWDGTLRLTDWLSTYLGAAPSEYHRAVGPMVVLAMIARIRQPGCKADYMMVLEGPQGILKSKALATLAGGYYSDTLPDLGGDHVRVAMHLRGKWLIEVSELSAFSKAEASKLKAFLSSQVEQYTPKFAHAEVREPRQCIFAGTTNDSEYLKDDTGSRRFWPVPCGAIDVDALERDRDQIFAEAVEAYSKGAVWWPDRAFEAQHFVPVQSARTWVDAWDAPVRHYLAGRTRVALMDVAEEALGFPKSRFGVGEQRRLAALMRGAGWTLKRSNTDRYWEMP